MKIRQIFSKALSPKPTSEPAPKKASGCPPCYQLLEGTPLGEGGYGTVFEATVNGDFSQRVAIKRIALSRVREESLHREVRIGRQLSHPNIVKCLDSFTTGSDFHMVMELVKGGELFERVISLGVMSEQESATHFGQLLLAVHHCHSKGVAHRDIKLENILLVEDRTLGSPSPEAGSLKLIDFGLAALHDVVNGRPVPRVLKDKCGSKSYAAPEINTGRGYNGFAADTWSCGICLFAMLAGFFPLDEAKDIDWRFRRFCRAESAGQSVCATIFAFYGRTCPFSADAVTLLEGMLRVNPFERLRVDELLASPWLRHNASPRVRALIELTLSPLSLSALSHADTLEEELRPSSAPTTAVRGGSSAMHTVAPKQPLTPPAQPPSSHSSLAANLERAYATLSAVVAPQRAAAQHAQQQAQAQAEQQQHQAGAPAQEPQQPDGTSARNHQIGAGAGAGAGACGGGEHSPIAPPPDSSRKRRPHRGTVGRSTSTTDGASGAASHGDGAMDTGFTPHSLPTGHQPQPTGRTGTPRRAAGVAGCFGEGRRPVYRSFCASKATLDAAISEGEHSAEFSLAATAAPTYCGGAPDSGLSSPALLGRQRSGWQKCALAATGSSSQSGSRNGLAPGISAVFSYSSDEDLGRQLEQLDVNPGAEAGGGPSRPLRGTHFRGALVLGCVQVQPQTGVRTLEQAADEGEVEERRRTSREPARMPALKRQRARGGSEGTN